MKENEKDILSKIQNHKEERLELLNQKIKEKFERDEEFFKNFRFKEERKFFLNDLQKTIENDLRGSEDK